MTTPCPTIHTYTSANAPWGRRWFATFVRETRPNANGATYTRSLPVTFYGSTEEAVVESATRWWDEQQQLEAARDARAAERAAKRGAGR